MTIRSDYTILRSAWPHDNIFNCINTIGKWMASNWLMLNPMKTRWIHLIGRPAFHLKDEIVKISSVFKNFWAFVLPRDFFKILSAIWQILVLCFWLSWAVISSCGQAGPRTRRILGHTVSYGIDTDAIMCYHDMLMHKVWTIYRNFFCLTRQGDEVTGRGRSGWKGDDVFVISGDEMKIVWFWWFKHTNSTRDMTCAVWTGGGLAASWDDGLRVRIRGLWMRLPIRLHEFEGRVDSNRQRFEGKRNICYSL